MSTSTNSVRVPSAPETRVLSLTSLLLGIMSILGGYMVGAPALGLVLGVLAAKREAHRTMAIWGIVLNSIMLAGTVIVLILLAFGIAIFTPLALSGLIFNR